jgi:hypothetical protein
MKKERVGGRGLKKIYFTNLRQLGEMHELEKKPCITLDIASYQVVTICIFSGSDS